MPRDPVSKDEYNEWRNNRVTKAFLEELFETREQLKEDLVEMKNSTDQDRFVTIGRCQALKDAIDHAIFEFDYIGKYDNVEVGSTPNNS